MPQLIRPSKVTIVPKEGEIEITLNINITLDGKVTATADNAERVTVQEEEEDDEIEKFIPQLTSGFKLDFGKKEN